MVERTAMKFATLDLNLLRVFDAMMEERSTTRAGDRLGVTQSAVSHSVARLRDLLGDELFIRTPAGMEPTPRARSLAPRLRAGLLQLHAALAEKVFDPATSTRRFNLIANPYACAVLLPAVLAHLRTRAPGVTLRVRPNMGDVTEALDAGRLCVAIAHFGRAPDRLEVQELMQDRLVWVLRAGHPAAAGPLTLESLAAILHLVRGVTDENAPTADGMVVEHGLERRVVQDDDGALTRALSGIGLDRKVGLIVPDSNAALSIVGQTDMAALVSRRPALAAAAAGGLCLFDPPYDSPPVSLTMAWHRGHGSDPASEWLRGLLVEAAAGL